MIVRLACLDGAFLAPFFSSVLPDRTRCFFALLMCNLRPQSASDANVRIQEDVQRSKLPLLRKIKPNLNMRKTQTQRNESLFGIPSGLYES